CGPLVLQPVGQVLLRYRPGLQVISQARQRGAQRYNEGRVRRGSLVRTSRRELGQARGQTIGRVGAGTARVAGQLGQCVGGALQRDDRLRVGRRARGVLRAQRRLQLPRKTADQRELAILSIWNELRDRSDLVDLRYLTKPIGDVVDV